MHNIFQIVAVVIGILTQLSVVAFRKKLPKVPAFIVVLLMIAAIAGIYFAPFGFDRYQYQEIFLNAGTWSSKDLGWEIYNSFFRFFFGGNSDLFFLCNAIIYTLCFYLFAKKTIPHDDIYYYLLLVFISLGYYSGGTNVMRTGLSVGLVFIALSRYNKIVWFAVFSLFAVSIHASSLLIIGGLLAGKFYPRLKIYFILWCLCLMLSNTDFAGSFLQSLIDVSGDNGERLAHYYSQAHAESHQLYAKMGWRLDFIIYSAVPLLFVWLYKAKYQVKDKFYDIIVSTYLICNSFWLLVIKMPFTDRVALLSWVFIPLLCTYPLFKYQQIPQKGLLMAIALAMPIGLNLISLI